MTMMYRLRLNNRTLPGMKQVRRFQNLMFNTASHQHKNDGPWSRNMSLEFCQTSTLYCNYHRIQNSG